MHRNFFKSCRAVLSLAGVLVVAQGVSAQDLGVKAPKQGQPIVINGATLHTVTGPTIEHGYLVINNGLIRAMGAGDAPPLPMAQIIDATGKHVYPGLIGADTIMGLTEIGAVRATIDSAETGDITPEVRAAVAVNPDSTIIPVTRLNGILTCGVLPQGGAIPGRAAVIRMDGWTWEDLAIDADAGLVVNWPNMRPVNAWWMRSTPEEQLQRAQERLEQIDEMFDAANAYAAARKADASLPSDIRFEAMGPAMHGGKPVFIRANELEQIQSAVSWAERRHLHAVIVGGRDAAKCADMLKRHDVGVIITGTHRLPGRRDDAYDAAYTLPLQLEEAGVKWCLASGDETPHERSLPYQAGLAVAYGLPLEAAVRSVTQSAAELLGVGDRLGSLEPGKAGTIIITDGNPLDIISQVDMAFIDGRQIDLESKQTVLDEKYREKYRQLGILPSQQGSSQEH
ncbi:MAG: amidohydrolase family protein [Phycisphaerales bacterium]|nr:amidohydrolase family protein [Phycisphaerales bacterium]